VYNRKRIGPRTHPCGTPNSTAVGVDLVDPLRKYCQRPLMYDVNQLCAPLQDDVGPSRSRPYRKLHTDQATSAMQGHHCLPHTGCQPVLLKPPSLLSGGLGRDSATWKEDLMTSNTVKRGFFGPFRTYLFPYLQHETHYYDQLLYQDVHSDDN
jgi:hypothetical protein